jgi:hypothetical protein
MRDPVVHGARAAACLRSGAGQRVIVCLSHGALVRRSAVVVKIALRLSEVWYEKMCQKTIEKADFGNSSLALVQKSLN